MKKLIVGLLAVFLIAPVFAGDRFDGLNYGSSLEGVILDREINGLDILRNPANLFFDDKGQSYDRFRGLLNRGKFSF